jgi:hypothetical protein
MIASTLFQSADMFPGLQGQRQRQQMTSASRHSSDMRYQATRLGATLVVPCSKVTSCLQEKSHLYLLQKWHCELGSRSTSKRTE